MATMEDFWTEDYTDSSLANSSVNQ